MKQWFAEWLESVQEWFKHDFKRPWSWWGIWHVGEFFAKIYRICAYIPVLWNNEDFDSGYILRLLQYKIRRTREHIGTHRMHTLWRRDCANMRKVEILLERLINDDYVIKEYRIHAKKWPWKTVPCKDHPGYTQLVDYGPAQHRDTRRLSALHQKLREADKKALWEMLDKHLEEWWD